MSDHYIIISTYKKSEIPLIRFHVNYLNLIETKKKLKFFIVANPEIFDFARNELNQIDNIETIKGVASFFTPYDVGSYHHAANLRIGTLQANVKNKIVTYIDPDFFFINTNFSEIISKLHDSGYNIVGMEWGHINYNKLKDFVAPHFFSIDFRKLSPDGVIFNPELEITNKKRIKYEYLEHIINQFKQNYLLRKISNLVILPIYAWLRIKSSYDTLSILRNYIKKNNIPIFLFKNNINEFDLNSLDKMKEAFPIYSRYWLPKLIGYVPKETKSREHSFIKHTNPGEYKLMRPEEISYDNKLFALHMRTVKNFYKIIGKDGTGEIQLNFLKNYFTLNGIFEDEFYDF